MGVDRSRGNKIKGKMEEEGRNGDFFLCPLSFSPLSLLFVPFTYFTFLS
jgi:hypothetical protein